MKHLGEELLYFRRTFGDESLILFKSDVAEAYRLLPVHPFWQIKQVNTLDGNRSIDRCNAFGGRGSGSIWISVNGLVTWIARYVKEIPRLLVYSDDSYSICKASSLVKYDPFNKFMPADQVALMNLWTELGIPFKEKKQIFGAPLTIIGIEVDPNAMSFTLPQSKRTELIAEIEKFCSIPPHSRGSKHTLREWQRLAGWMNWSFNVFPLLRPSLNSFYAKISGKDAPNANIWVNNLVREDLLWAANHIKMSSGVYLLRTLDWGVDNSDLTIYCDACMEGMGFWYPDHSLGYYSPVPDGIPTDFIFYYEALCVLSAFFHASEMSSAPLRIVIFTDNTNTVDIFNSMRGLPAYNYILRSSVDVRLRTDHQLRVLHVPGLENDVADAISRRQFRAIALGQSIDTSTWNNYSSALNSYLEFVKIHNFPVDPTTETLSFFTVFMCFHIKPDSVDTYLSGICQQLEPFFPDVRKNRKSMLVKRTLEGCMRIRAIPTSRKRALTVENLCTVVYHYSGSSMHDDLLFIAILLIAFFALMRLGELTYPDTKKLRNPLKVIKRTSVLIS
ncbi:hypothetical protein GALMADRAFT_82606, partial [Galerina marginata CBS 339.88]